MILGLLKVSMNTQKIVSVHLQEQENSFIKN